MPLIASEANLMLTTESARLAFLSLHTADPGTTGTGEAATPRQPLTWNPAAAGAISSQPASFQPPAGTYVAAGYWSAATGGTYLGDFTFTTPRATVAGDTLKVTANLGETLS